MKKKSFGNIGFYVLIFVILLATVLILLNDNNTSNVSYAEVKELFRSEQVQQFQLQAGFIEKSGYKMPVFECLVKMENLLADLDHQLVVNKIAELEQNHRFTGWKVGDMTQAITDGNFE